MTTKLSIENQVGESQWLAQLIQSVTSAHISENPATIINIYVALKSKPMLLLAGPAGGKKSELVRCLAQHLLGSDCYQCQILTGHPWWIAPGQNFAFFSHVHSRFTSEKILCLLEEAILPQNRQKPFIAGLVKLGPGELKTYFSEVSFQLQRGELIHFGDLHLNHPVPFPLNLHWIGTMDVERFRWWDPDLLASTTVVHWSEESMSEFICPLANHLHQQSKSNVFAASVRSKQAVYRKLHTILEGMQQPLAPLSIVNDMLTQHSIDLPAMVNGDIATYLANAWADDGAGLFHSSTDKNLNTALDYAFAQYLLPRIEMPLKQSTSLFVELESFFQERFPYTHQQLSWISGSFHEGQIIG